LALRVANFANRVCKFANFANHGHTFATFTLSFANFARFFCELRKRISVSFENFAKGNFTKNFELSFSFWCVYGLGSFEPSNPCHLRPIYRVFASVSKEFASVSKEFASVSKEFANVSNSNSFPINFDFDFVSISTCLRLIRVLFPDSYALSNISDNYRKSNLI
jgi:hypothetical protein